MQFCARSVGVIVPTMSSGRRDLQIRHPRCSIPVWIVGISGIKIDLYIYGVNNVFLRELDLERKYKCLATVKIAFIVKDANE